MDARGTEIDPASTDIAGYAGQTLTVYAVPDNTGTVEDPSATAGLDAATATPYVTVSNVNADATVKYAVTDENGTGVDVISGTQMQAKGGTITGSYLHPGDDYRIYEALSSSGIAVGDPIGNYASPNISSNPAQVKVPVCLTPSVTEDANHAGSEISA